MAGSSSNPSWSVTASGRYATDRTFMRRYDISRDDRLRSVVDAERITADSYISIAGWAFQGLRVTDLVSQQPIALPAIDARWRIVDPWLDGQIELQANSLAILRPEGQDSQRAFASARWEHRSITPLGQELALTAFARGDVYHANDTALTPVAIYRGEEGWNGRFIAAAAADLRWPFVGNFLGGTQRFTPRLQFVASPPTENLDIPNEDARSVDLEDSNLFALNRFPGYDRWEDGVRVTYGADWAVDLPGISFRTNIGQSYRLSSPRQHPAGGHRPVGALLRFRRPHQPARRPDGSAWSTASASTRTASRSAATRSTPRSAAGRPMRAIGYLRLDRDIDPAIEDLRDREEVRLGGRLRFAALLVDLRLDGDRSHRPAGGPAFDRGRIRPGSPPPRHPLRRRLHRAWRDLAARL